MIITIDGPAGTGKTTVARKVAERLHFSYFDTGAMYRCVAWSMLKKGIDPKDLSKVEELLKHFSFFIKTEGDKKKYLIGNYDVTEEIRSQEVADMASSAGTLKPVREHLSTIQRQFALEGNAVFEGRDLGTVIFPEAELKIFLTARPEVRAQRRLNEMRQKHPQIAMDEETMLADLVRRDEKDSTRTLAPLKCAPDAYQIDTSDLSIDEVVDLILRYKRNKFN